MNCQICNSESADRYCSDCKHIRSVYVIHKLAEKIPLNEKFNTNTLIIKKLKNIEKYDLELLVENGLLIRDRLSNYKWTSIEEVNKYLSEHDNSGKKIKIRDDSKDKTPAVDEVIVLLEKTYNITDTFDEDDLSSLAKMNKNQTKKTIKKLIEENLIKKSFYGKYKLDFTQILKYKKTHKIKEDKIKTLGNIKDTTNIKKTKTTISKDNKKSTTKTKNSKTTKNKPPKKDKTKNNTKEINKRPKNDNRPLIHQPDSDDKTIHDIREFINTQLIILPRNVKENDITLEEIFNEYAEYSGQNIKKEDFNRYFHRIINTYPHIRHKKIDHSIQYNIKSRKTPQLTLNDIQKNTKKFTCSDDSQVQLNENTLEVDAYIPKDELPQLYNLIVYTHENITEYKYKVIEDRIHIEIVYDLNEENPDLWLKFLKSYNLSFD